MNAPLPAREKARLATLESYQILDTASDEAFDRITRLASTILGCPISVISFVDSDRQWFKSHLGLDASETPRSAAFCAHAILSNDVLIVEDAAKDERFANNPLVTGAPNIRFYAGAPLITPEGHKLGTLCTIDQIPRQLTLAEKEALRDLAGMVMNELELRRLASIDSLTQAFNRRFFLELMNREITRACRHKLPLSLLMMDVDHFKSFNDTYGHHAGDLALVHLVEQTRKVLRAQDVMGRLGGEEFAVLLPHTGHVGAQVLAEKLRTAISSSSLRVGAAELAVTVSVGMAQHRSGAEDLTELLERADQALYAAKSKGRNQVVLAEAV
jgi:diguanylate cyclase (GGDEF)-like protein